MVTPSNSKKAKIKAEAETFDWSRLDTLSDDDIEGAAKSDPDVVLLTEVELAGTDLVIPPKARRRNKQAAE